tara:strand:+ start:5245 stop:7257 length:2013 start_codon:yes stop_codon:yes gene_type:complete
MKYLNKISSILGVAVLAVVLLAANSVAQEKKIVFAKEKISLKLNEEIKINAKVVDANGKTTQDSLVFFTRDRRSLIVTPDGNVKAIKSGEFSIFARALTADRNDRISATLAVSVAYPPVKSVTFVNAPKNFYNTTTISLKTKVTDEANATRDNVDVMLTSSNPEVASIDAYGNLKAHKKGNFTITARAENKTAIWKFQVSENPITFMEISHNYDGKSIRTGDVVTFKALAKTSKGEIVSDAPIKYTYIAEPDDNLGQGASAQVAQSGKFVASDPGLFTIIATAGDESVSVTIKTVPRNVQRPLTLVGKGILTHTRTSDLWVWEGVDGRDYAVTGTWGGNGEAIFWDVTDPSNIISIDTVVVDARTVNDVKVSEDGKVAVITREGASDRKNGIIILDVTNPRDVKILSEYTEGLTGGVHNTFIYDDHVYAVNNGRKYDVINIEDPKNPRTVGVFELDTPGHSIHDVWIQDGIAYSSNWSDGIVAVDVGGTANADLPGAGGSPENPVQLGSYSYPSGWNHAAFPFKSESTGDFYVIAGDEAFPYGLNVNGPNRAAGWLHFVKFDDWDSPQEVARFQVPEAGTHNYWVDGDILYAAFYNGGLRVIDISGELMGDLYEQGREIASFYPSDSKAFIPNATFTWGPQYYKGYVFISDWNSGIWALKLGESTSQGTN